ncbi:hypothetical protein Tsp_02221 [Trichinella spiralis]|nr:hypothetical protein Tsp_02221 [Trichinella spiralis]
MSAFMLAACSVKITRNLSKCVMYETIAWDYKASATGCKYRGGKYL